MTTASALPRWQRMLKRRRGLRMPLWAGLVLIAIGFAAIAIGMASRQDGRDVVPLSAETLPDVYLEDGDIARFRDDGTLHYRLRANRIEHFEQAGPGSETTRLAVPTLTLHTPDGPPWHLAARDGEVHVKAPTSPTREAATAHEQATLRGDVLLAQRHGDGRFTELRTDALTLHLGLETAHADQPVMIATESSRSTAAGFSADLASGRFELRSSPSKRVSVVVEPPPS